MCGSVRICSDLTYFLSVKTKTPCKMSARFSKGSRLPRGLIFSPKFQNKLSFKIPLRKLKCAARFAFAATSLIFSVLKLKPSVKCLLDFQKVPDSLEG